MNIISPPMVSIDFMGSLRSLAQRFQRNDASRQAVSQGVLDEKVYDAVETERRRLARIIHDELAQLLTVANIELALVAKSTAGTAIHQSVLSLKDHVTSSSRIVRNIMADLTTPRVSHNFTKANGNSCNSRVFESTQQHHDLSLTCRLQRLADRMQHDFGLKVEVVNRLSSSPDARILEVLVRSVGELLVNIAKHAESPLARVFINGDGQSINVTVEDEGVGFDVSRAVHRADGTGYGLQSIREDLDRRGGAMSIESAKGRGTRIALKLPHVVRTARNAAEVTNIGQKYLAALNDRLLNKSLPSGSAA